MFFSGKAEQYRCKNFLVIFQLRWSDIFVKTKVILKPSVSVILYLPLNCAKHNITRRKTNITAQQYNLPQANITEKTTCRNKSFFQDNNVYFDRILPRGFKWHPLDGVFGIGDSE